MKLESLLDDQNVTVVNRIHAGDVWYAYQCNYSHRHNQSTCIVKFMAMANLRTGLVHCLYIGHDKATLGFVPPVECVVRKAKRLSNSKYEIKAWVKTHADLVELCRMLSKETLMLIY